MASVPDLDRLIDHYRHILAEHGPTPQGVGWNSPQRQLVRFEYLGRCFERDDGFSLLDIGCGYGAMFDYITGLGMRFAYTGVDFCEEMVAEARRLHAGSSNCTFEIGRQSAVKHDYVVSSGIFNVSHDTPRPVWERYVHATMAEHFGQCRKACAWNFLTTYSDEDKRRPGHYYAEPATVLDFCVRHLTRNVNLYHHYGIWDFTVCAIRET